MDEKKAPTPRVDVKIIKSSSMDTPTVFYEQQKVEKSDKGEQLDLSIQTSASDWIPHAIDMRGLKILVDNSTILPQCIRAYKSNIAGFGISVRYAEDYDTETPEMKAEWDALKQIIALLNMDMQTKEVWKYYQILTRKRKSIVVKRVFDIVFAIILLIVLSCSLIRMMLTI